MTANHSHSISQKPSRQGALQLPINFAHINIGYIYSAAAENNLIYQRIIVSE